MTNEEIGMLWVYARQLWPLFEIPDDATARRIKMQAWNDVFRSMPAEVVREAMLVQADSINPTPGLLASTARRILERREEESRAMRPRLTEEGTELATAEYSRSALSDIRRTLGMSDGPLAAALRGAVKGSPHMVCLECGQPTARVGAGGFLVCAGCAIKDPENC